jgi:hypothetical protein
VFALDSVNRVIAGCRPEQKTKSIRIGYLMLLKKNGIFKEADSILKQQTHTD